MSKPADRESLPYCPTVICFVQQGKKFVAKIRDHSVVFPGGPIRDGETPESAAQREFASRTGLQITKPRQLAELFVDWPPEWAQGSKKRESLFKDFRGEHIYFLYAYQKRTDAPVDDQGSNSKWNADDDAHWGDVLVTQIEKSKAKVIPAFAPVLALEVALLRGIRYATDSSGRNKKAPQAERRAQFEK